MMLAETARSALWFLPFAAPIALWVAWSDMARMKIPNKAVGALMLVFLAVGLVALPFDVWKWRLVHFLVILAIGFVMSSLGMLGAGDAKFAAAMAPFVAPGDISLFLYLLAPTVIAAFIIHRLVRQMDAVRRRFPDWESWERADFPMGLALGPALIFYLLAGAIWGS
ncbi:MAG TPA: hypothetical protein ENK41_05935 [Rhodobacteraceae bacterium]|nr:hypothetical protein [Paracoccaceae bacterium]